MFDRASLLGSRAAWSLRSFARFQDVDAAGVVFFAQIFAYFHDAYLAFMAERGLPHQEVLAKGEWGAPIRHASADFVSPIRFGDALDIGLVRAAFSADSVLTIGYRVAIGDRVAAVGRTEHVLVAFPKRERIAPPAEFRALFAGLE